LTSEFQRQLAKARPFSLLLGFGLALYAYLNLRDNQYWIISNIWWILLVINCLDLVLIYVVKALRKQVNLNKNNDTDKSA